MAEVLTEGGRWAVSTRSSGEVLAVRVAQAGLQLGFVGCPRGLRASEIEGWLAELGAMAAAAEPAGEPGALPIPRSLHQALTGLLFLQAEVWGDPPDRVPLTLVVVEQGDRVALGWAGSGRVTVLRDDAVDDPEWIVVRDGEGREARALVADAASPLVVGAEWSAAGPVPLRGVLEAEWPGRATARAEEVPAKAPAEEPAAEAAFEPLRGPAPEALPEERADVGSEPVMDAIPAPAAEAPPEPEVEAPARPRPRPFWRFRGWMDRLAERARGQEALAPLPPPDPDPIAHDVPGVPDLLPEPVAAEEPPVQVAPPGPVPLEVEQAVPAPEPAVVEAPPVEAVAPETVSLEAERIVDEGPGEAPPEPIVEPDVPDEAPVDAAPAAPGPLARARRLEWPAEEERRRPRLRWRRSWTIAAVVVGLFALGWLLGHVDAPAAGKAIGSAFTSIGLGPARYEVDVTSRPAGAWIAVDGVDQGRRTPASLSLRPGPHDITLSLSGEGGATHPVNGKRGERVALDVALWGGLRIDAPAGSAPLTVTVDGMPRGYVPLVIERLQPGIHRLQFSGPGVTPWEQTVEVHVDRTAVVLAQPVVSPPTGVLEVKARLSDDTGAEPLAGAAVRIDGQHRGVTPLRLELPRGPHSIRVSYRGEDSPVQVIDLPGGNQRYATLDIGLSLDQPRLSATLPDRVPRAGATVLSATLERAREGDVREMWLHARTPEGAWRRYAMSVMNAPSGQVGVVVFPTDLFGPSGRTAWYVSVLAPTGDEYFTEIRTAQAAAK